MSIEGKEIETLDASDDPLETAEMPVIEIEKITEESPRIKSDHDTQEIPTVPMYNIEVLEGIKSIINARISEITLPSRMNTSEYLDYIKIIFSPNTFNEVMETYHKFDLDVLYDHMNKVIIESYNQEIVDNFKAIYDDAMIAIGKKINWEM